MCTECAASSGGLCASCRQRVLVDPSALNERVRDATGLLYLNCATSGLAVVCFILAAAFSSETWLTIYSVVVFAGFILFWGSAITFLKWEHFTVRGVNALGHDVGATPRWSVGAWFIPFANIIWPYLVIRRMVVSVGGESTLQEAKVGAWWVLWVLNNLATQMYSFDEDPHLLVVVVSEFITIMAALAAIRVIKTLSRAVVEAGREEVILAIPIAPSPIAARPLP